MNVKYALGLITCILLNLFSPATASTFTPIEYQQDIRQACDIVTQSYVYFDIKFSESKDTFKDKCYTLTDLISERETLQGFIKAMNTMRSWIHDGHVDWRLPHDLCDSGGDKYLGIVPTWKNRKLVIGRVAQKYYIHGVKVGDEIIEWNNLPTIQALENMISCEPQSVQLSNYEIAARNLAMFRACRPCGDISGPVVIKLRESSGAIKKVVLGWKDIPIEEITRNNYLSLATPIPEKHISVGKEKTLIAYNSSISGIPVAIIHLYRFADWGQEDMDQVVKYVIEGKPRFLVVDLKDTAGGSFEQVLYLSYALNVKKDFKFAMAAIDKSTGRRLSFNSNFGTISKQIKLKNVWKGEVLFFTNSICGSGCDYFARWMQLNNRGKFIGTPTNGRGGGTDDFVLENTRTVLSMPLRDRIIKGDKNHVEGHPVQPDYMCYGDLENCISDCLDQI